MVAVKGHAVIPAGVSSVPARQDGSYSPMDGAVEVRAGSSSRNVLIVATCTQHEFHVSGVFSVLLLYWRSCLQRTILTTMHF